MASLKNRQQSLPHLSAGETNDEQGVRCVRLFKCDWDRHGVGAADRKAISGRTYQPIAKRIGKRELTSKGLRRCSEISVSQHQPRSIAAGYWPNIKTLTSLTVPICRKVMPTPACPSDA